MSTISIEASVQSVLPTVCRLRHQLHQTPEVHPHEHETRALLLRALEDLPLQVWDPLLETDLIVELPGASKRIIVLRADIDALPIQEATGKAYASGNAGVMHACGHDGHAAMLVGAARVLAACRERLPVTVRFVFQPGEELAACGKDLVAAGACDGAEAAFALHGWPWLAEGVLSSMAGPMFAAADFFRLRFAGIGGHAALPPDEVANPLVPAARAIGLIEEFREQLWADHGAIITAASLQGGLASNVISDLAVLEGTVRYFETETGELVQDRLTEIAAAVQTDGVQVELTSNRAYWLPVRNTKAALDHVSGIVQRHFPAGTWQPAKQPTLGAEDFAFYLQDRDGAMTWLGLGRDWPKLHTPEFDFNDRVLETGIRFLSLIALEYK